MGVIHPKARKNCYKSYQSYNRYALFLYPAGILKIKGCLVKNLQYGRKHPCNQKSKEDASIGKHPVIRQRTLNRQKQRNTYNTGKKENQEQNVIFFLSPDT